MPEYIPGKNDFKELKKTPLLGTAHILGKVQRSFK
jgi:hypothetical protein